MARTLITRNSQLAAYLLIVVMGVIGFTAIQHQATQRVKDRQMQTVALCNQSRVNREALRDNANAVADLGVGLVRRGNGTEGEKQRAIATFEAYRTAQLNKLPEIKCNTDGTTVEVK